MTEEAVRTIFLKNYSGDRSLNETLMVSIEEMLMAVLAEMAEPGEVLPDIVRTIAGGNSRIGLFAAIFAAGVANPVVPISYIHHFDHIRKAMLDTIVYMHDNYDTVQPWFRKRFTREALKMMSGDKSEAIEKPTGLPANVRGLNFTELKKEEAFFNMALIGILGVEKFLEYAQAYNKCAVVLRQCQTECKLLGAQVDAKES